MFGRMMEMSLKKHTLSIMRNRLFGWAYFYCDVFNKPQLEVLRVAAYVRVSTEREEQEESFELQKAYFEELLNENPNWISVGIYSEM